MTSDTKITRVTIWHLPLTSHVPYHMTDGKSCETVETVVVRLDTDGGLSGVGEVCPIPHYLPAYVRGVAPAIEEMAPIILGADPIGPEALMARLDRHLPGHVYAKSAIDIALWDLLGRAADLPLYTLLGGRQAETLSLYHSISCLDPHEMARIAVAAKAEGILQFQAKLGADRDWQADVARLRLVREAVGPGPLVYGDWNCGASRLE
ncbi:MAG: mandelate racemase/muconate lactonizing enzyme family protein, partial [Geminicoccaceae bacterium]